MSHVLSSTRTHLGNARGNEHEKWQRYRALLVRYIEALRDRAKELSR